ncbi:hypothetical protein HY793_00700 [Candidatus Desantisbacteria bacterium]|nr:hypothetical protein [Candidatus Desantisbacteria bacterium]
MTLYKATGCKDCAKTGYRGRVGIYEIMAVSEKIRELVLERESASAIRETAYKEGMVALKTSAAEKVLLGLTSVEEYLRVT